MGDEKVGIFIKTHRAFRLAFNLGIKNLTRVAFAYIFNKQAALTLKNIKSPIKVRPWTSDLFAFEQVFSNGEYEFSIDIKPKLIIDGGANVGYTSIFFANKFANAHILAVEPESSNVALLRENALPYPNVEVIQSAIWNKTTHLKVKDVGLGNWGFIIESTNSNDPEAFVAMTIQDLIKYSCFETADIVKLDIEGSEKEVFSENYESWLGDVSILIIELHDRMKEGCSDTFINAVNKYNFNVEQHGENIVLRRVI
jgi:FkbM family methyltransferase